MTTFARYTIPVLRARELIAKLRIEDPSEIDITLIAAHEGAQWRKGHPGYWRKKNAEPQALQDLVPSEVIGSEAFTVQEHILSRGADLMFRPVPSQMELALQDLASCQVPLLAGVVSLLIGDALQDRFADFARELVDRGKRVLSAER